MEVVVINKDEWVYVPNDEDHKTETAFFNNELQSSLRDTKRHTLFPPIVREQFIQGSEKYLPLYHDGIKGQAAHEYDDTVRYAAYRAGPMCLRDPSASVADKDYLTSIVDVP